MSEKEIRRRIEQILSEILSNKYGAKITITFTKGADIDGDCDTTTIVREE